MATITYLTTDELGTIQHATVTIPDVVELPPDSLDTDLMIASEDIYAGAFVNVWSSGGDFRIRLSTATDVSRRADAFVTENIVAGGTGKVYFEDTNNAVSGVTPGPVYLGVIPGSFASTPPLGSKMVIQRIGLGVRPTAINVEFSTPIVRA